MSATNYYVMSEQMMGRLLNRNGGKVPKCHKCGKDILVGMACVGKAKQRKTVFKVYHQSCYDSMWYGSD